MAFQLDLGALAGFPNIVVAFIGASGGGGAELGEGGDQPPSIVAISLNDPGSDGTGGINGQGGQGGLLNVPISVPIVTVPIVGAISLDLEPNIVGGDGGDYGFAGTQGSFTVDVFLNVFFPVYLTTIPFPVPPPAGGEGGFAIQHNGNTINIPDNFYFTGQLRGNVGP
jgi:hypothetical protein